METQTIRKVSKPVAPKAGQTYRIVFWGETARGTDRNRVAKLFAARFKITSRRVLNHLFSGKVITLKHNLPVAQAHRYVTAIQEVGAVCRLELESKEYFVESELKERNEVSFLASGFNPSNLALSPKK